MPNHIGTWLAYGWCQLTTNDPRAARVSFEEAMLLDRNVAETDGGLAVALARIGQVASAQEEIEIALRLDPKNLSVRYAQSLLSGEGATRRPSHASPGASCRRSRRVRRGRSGRSRTWCSRRRTERRIYWASFGKKEESTQ